MMSDSVPPAARYRRFAWQCLEVAYTFPSGDNRAVLLQMAQVWQRLADQHEDSTFLLIQPDAGQRPVMQQQHQIQPDDDKE
jgi:hypothetical protein